MSSKSGPWAEVKRGGEIAILSEFGIVARLVKSGEDYTDEDLANAHILSAATDLLEAAELLELAEDANANCDECVPEDAPECCEKCFPLFDDARVKRRLAINKARGGSVHPISTANRQSCWSDDLYEAGRNEVNITPEMIDAAAKAIMAEWDAAQGVVYAGDARPSLSFVFARAALTAAMAVRSTPEDVP